MAAHCALPDARRGYQVARFPHGDVTRYYGQDDQRQNALVLYHRAWHRRTLHWQTAAYPTRHSPVWHGLTGIDLLRVAAQAGAH